MIHDRRNTIVRADRQKFRLELLAGPDVDGNDGIGKAEFLQHDRDFPAIRRRRVIEVDHGDILREAARILACCVTPFQPACGLVGRMANMAHRHSIRTVREAQMLFPTTIAGSLPKPEWLAEPNTLWAPWKSKGDELARAKRDATLLAVKLQEDAGIDIVTEGEQARQHFVHGFLEKIEGIDFAHKVEMGIRKDRYKAMVPQVVAPLAAEGPRPCRRGPRRPHPHRAQAEIHPARPDDHHRHHRRQVLRRPRQDGVRLRRTAQRGSQSLAGRRRRRHPVRRARLQRLHGRGLRLGHQGAGARRRRSDLRHRRAHLLRLRHQGQHRLEADARQRVAAVRGYFSGDRQKPDPAGRDRMPQFAGCRWNCSACSRARSCRPA